MMILPVGYRRTPQARFRIDVVVIAPAIRIQGAVANAPNRRTGEPVRSGTGSDLDLAIASAHFSVDRRQDEPDFGNHVRIDHRGAEDTVLKTAVAHAKAVANGVDGAGTDAGKRILIIPWRGVS